MLTIGLFAFVTAAHNVNAKDDELDDKPWETAIKVLPTFITGGGGGGMYGDVNQYVGAPTKARSYYPLPVGNYNVQKNNQANISGDLGYNIGCDGVNIEKMISAKTDQFISATEAFFKNAPTMFIWWLAYSNPTAKDIIDGLDISANFGLSLGSSSCQNARSLAKQGATPFDRLASANAESKCAQDNGICQQPEEVEKEEASSKVKAVQNYMDSVQKKVNYYLGSNASGSNQDECKMVEKLDDSNPLKGLIVDSGLPCTDQKYILPIMPQYQLYTDGSPEEVGKINKESYIAPEKTVVELYNDSLDAIKKSLLSLQGISNKSTFLNKYNSVIRDTLQLSLTSEQYSAMYNAAQDTNNYQPMVDDLSHSLAVIRIKNALKRINRVINGTLPSNTTPQGDTFQIYDEYYRDLIGNKLAEIEDIAQLYKDSAEIQAVINQTLGL